MAVCSLFVNNYVAFETPVEILQTSRCLELGGAHGSQLDVSGFDIAVSQSSSVLSTSLFRLVVTTTKAKLFQSLPS